MKMVSDGELDHIHISFMLAGCTEFAPDCMFSSVGGACKSEDIFSIDDLKGICDRVATTFIDNGDTVFTWWDTVVANYSNIPGVRMLHDFLVVKSYNGEVMVKVREHCYEGSWTNSPTLLHLPFQLQPIGRNIIISYQLIKWQNFSPCMTGLFPLATVEHICHLCNKS